MKKAVAYRLVETHPAWYRPLYHIHHYTTRFEALGALINARQVALDTDPDIKVELVEEEAEDA